METTENLKLGISEQEDTSEKLQPKPVTVREIKIEEVGDKGAKKVVLSVVQLACIGFQITISNYTSGCLVSV